MKTRLLAIAVLSTLAASAQAQGLSWSAARFYLGAELGQSHTGMDSGGFNTLGPHPNTNEDTDRNNQWDVKAGVEMGRFRFDLGYREYERGKYTTDSFQPPVPTFFYTSKIKSKAWMLSAYYDIVQHNKWSVYGGAGLGQCAFGRMTAVVHHHVHAVFAQVERHGAAHGTETDESNSFRHEGTSFAIVAAGPARRCSSACR